MARYEPLEIEYKIATTFALAMMVSGFNYELSSPEYAMKIVTALNDMEIEAERMLDLPSLVFMLPSFMNEETEPMITQVIEQISATWFVVMRDRLDLLTVSTFALGWARGNMYNQDLLEQMADQVLKKHKEGIFFEEGSESEVSNILNGISQLGYRNEELSEALYEMLVGEEFKTNGEIAEQYDFFTLYTIVSAFARIHP